MRFYKFLLVSLACVAIFGCTKKDKMSFIPVTTLDNIEIKDIAFIENDLFVVLGRDNDKSVIYTLNPTTHSKSRRLSKNLDYNGLCFDNGELWMCGEDMNIRVSVDTGKTVDENRVPDFTYWKEWPTEKSNLLALYVKDGKPKYAIGKRDMLLGNFYYYNDDERLFHGGSQTQFGINDMVVYNDEVYVAGYGSIMHVTDDGATRTMENIGGENFTSIAIGGNYLFACTYSGKIYRSEIGSNSWKKISREGKKLLFIEADDYGDVIAMGETREVLVSMDFGNEWREEKYEEGRKISCLVKINNEFFAGTEKGTIIKINKESLAVNVED